MNEGTKLVVTLGIEPRHPESTVLQTAEASQLLIVTVVPNDGNAPSPPAFQTGAST